MSTINQSIVQGYVTNIDVKQLTSQSGNAFKVMNVILKVLETEKVHNSNEYKTTETLIKVNVKKKNLIDYLEKYLQQGQLLLVHGKLSTTSWVKDGKTSSFLEFVVQGLNSTASIVRINQPNNNSNNSNSNSNSNQGYNNQNQNQNNNHKNAYDHTTPQVMNNQMQNQSQPQQNNNMGYNEPPRGANFYDDDIPF